jgi:hypothetical protein
MLTRLDRPLTALLVALMAAPLVALLAAPLKIQENLLARLAAPLAAEPQL